MSPLSKSRSGLCLSFRPKVDQLILDTLRCGARSVPVTQTDSLATSNHTGRGQLASQMIHSLPWVVHFHLYLYLWISSNPVGKQLFWPQKTSFTGVRFFLISQVGRIFIQYIFHVFVVTAWLFLLLPTIHFPPCLNPRNWTPASMHPGNFAKNRFPSPRFQRGETQCGGPVWNTQNRRSEDNSLLLLQLVNVVVGLVIKMQKNKIILWLKIQEKWT